MDQNEVPAQEPDVWAIVDLLGHKRLAGKLTEVERFGSKLGRIDVPSEDGFVSHFFGAASVYSIVIVTERVARHVAKGTAPSPVSPWDFPKQLTAKAVVPVGDDDDESDEDPDDGF